MAEGEFALVRHILEQALSTPGEWIGDHELYAMIVDAAAQQPDRQALLQYAPLAEAAARRYDHTLYQAIALRGLGVAHRLGGDYQEAEFRLQRALDLLEGLQIRWQIGRTLRELGDLARARNDTARARDYYTRALAAFEAMRAGPDIVRARALLAQFGDDSAVAIG